MTNKPPKKLGMKKVLLCITVFITGCGFSNAYIKPSASEKTSNLRFVTDGVTGVHVLTNNQGEEDCYMNTSLASLAPQFEFIKPVVEDIGMPKNGVEHIPTSDRSEVTILAEKKFYVSLTHIFLGGSCGLTFGFLPKEGENYEVFTKYDYKKTSCSANISHLKKTDNNYIRIDEESAQYFEGTCE